MKQSRAVPMSQGGIKSIYLVEGGKPKLHKRKGGGRHGREQKEFPDAQHLVNCADHIKEKLITICSK